MCISYFLFIQLLIQGLQIFLQDLQIKFFNPNSEGDGWLYPYFFRMINLRDKGLVISYYLTFSYLLCTFRKIFFTVMLAVQVQSTIHPKAPHN